MRFLSIFSFTNTETLIKDVNDDLDNLENFMNESSFQKQLDQADHQALSGYVKLMLTQENPIGVQEVKKDLLHFAKNELTKKGKVFSEKKQLLTNFTQLVKALGHSQSKTAKYAKHQKKARFYIWSAAIIGALVLSAPISGLLSSVAATVMLVTVLTFAVIDFFRNLNNINNNKKFIATLDKSQNNPTTPAKEAGPNIQSAPQTVKKLSSDPIKDHAFDLKNDTEIITHRERTALKQKKHLAKTIKLELTCSIVAIAVAVLPLINPIVFGVAAFIAGLALVGLVVGFALKERQETKKEHQNKLVDTAMEITSLRTHYHQSEHNHDQCEATLPRLDKQQNVNKTDASPQTDTMKDSHNTEPTTDDNSLKDQDPSSRNTDKRLNASNTGPVDPKDEDEGEGEGDGPHLGG